MHGMIGIFGHLSVYQPESGRILITPGGASDKATTQAGDILVIDLSGNVLEGEKQRPIEWPIHIALHSARADALSVAHLHAPYATLIAIARREFPPVTFQAYYLSKESSSYMQRIRSDPINWRTIREKQCRRQC